MFGRSKRREEASALARSAARHEREMQKLRHEVVRLEGALIDVLAASDDVMVDLRRALRERAQLADQLAPGFADAWFNSEPATRGFDDFFAVGEVDKRARRWLLSSN